MINYKIKNNVSTTKKAKCRRETVDTLGLRWQRNMWYCNNNNNMSKNKRQCKYFIENRFQYGEECWCTNFKEKDEQQRKEKGRTEYSFFLKNECRYGVKF